MMADNLPAGHIFFPESERNIAPPRGYPECFCALLLLVVGLVGASVKAYARRKLFWVVIAQMLVSLKS